MESEKEVVVWEQSWSWSKEGGILDVSQRGERGRNKGDNKLHLMQCWQSGPGNCWGSLGQVIVASKEEKPVTSCQLTLCT